MKKTLIAIITFAGFSAQALAETPALQVDQHLAGSPETAGHLRFSYEPCPGTLSVITERSPFLNTLSVGIGDHLQVGLVPVMYAIAGSRNWTVKGNIFSNEYVSFGASWMRSIMTFKNEEKSITSYTDGFTLIGAGALGRNTFASASLSTDVSGSDDPATAAIMRNMEKPYEKFFDIGRRFAPAWSWATGISHTTDYLSERTDWTKKQYEWGTGASLAWHPQRMAISKIGLGAHRFLATRRTQYLFSFNL